MSTILDTLKHNTTNGLTAQQTLEVLSTGDKDVLYVLGMVARLKEAGIVNGPDVMTPVGMEMFTILEESDYQIEREKIDEIMGFIMSGALTEAMNG